VQAASSRAAAHEVRSDVSGKVMVAGSVEWLFGIDSRTSFYAGSRVRLS